MPQLGNVPHVSGQHARSRAGGRAFRPAPSRLGQGSIYASRPRMSLLANLAFHHRRAVLVLFALLTAAAVLYGRKTAQSLIAGGFDDPTSESSRADAQLEERFGMGTPDVLAIYGHTSL